jgi:hypothetical protein
MINDAPSESARFPARVPDGAGRTPARPQGSREPFPLIALASRNMLRGELIQIFVDSRGRITADKLDFTSDPRIGKIMCRSGTGTPAAQQAYVYYQSIIPIWFSFELHAANRDASQVRYISEAKAAVERLHRCKAIHVETIPVHHWQSHEVHWEGDVEVFALEGSV